VTAAKTLTATWLDYSKPPPGYHVDLHGDFSDALSAAWTHYKAERDPPGSLRCGAVGEHCVTFGRGLPHFQARSAAWAWHDRRRTIVVDIDDQTCSGGRELAAWLARALAWTEAKCSEIEAYAALPFPRSVDMPQALQRVLLPEAAR